MTVMTYPHERGPGGRCYEACPRCEIDRLRERCAEAEERLAQLREANEMHEKFEAERKLDVGTARRELLDAKLLLADDMIRHEFERAEAAERERDSWRCVVETLEVEKLAALERRGDAAPE